MEELNPVRRLHNILKEAVEKGDPSASAGDVLKKHIKVNNTSEKTQLLTEFLELLGNVGRTIKQLKRVGNLDYYVKPIQSLQMLFIDLSMNNTWENFRSPIISQNLLYCLGAFADTVEREASQEFYIRGYELQDFLEKFTLLLEEIDTSDIEENTKNFLKSRLEEICEAIRQFSFEDPEAFREKVNATIGKIFIGSINIIPQEEKEKKPFKDFIDLFLKFAPLVTLARTMDEWGIHKIANSVDHIQKLLSGG